MMKNDFEFVENDDLGNSWVRCPVCGAVKKSDGVIKHMIRMSQELDTAHSIWLKENYIPRGSPSKEEEEL